MKVAACLHGLLRTGVSMMPMVLALRRAGWGTVHTPTYAYQFRDFDAVAEDLAAQLRAWSGRNGGASIDLVTHSWGGLVARAVMDRAPVGRVVMLAPPNRGAQAAALVRSSIPVHRLGWDPLAPVLPGAPERLPFDPDRVAVITGGLGDGRGFNPVLDGDNDQTVRVEEARVEGVREFRVVPVRHTFIMMNPEVQAMTVRFLETGRL